MLEKGFSNERRQVAWEQEKKRKKLLVITFFLAFSKYLKALAKPFGVSVVFKNDFKLAHLSCFEGGKNAACTVELGQLVGDCVTGVVYQTLSKMDVVVLAELEAVLIRG